MDAFRELWSSNVPFYTSNLVVAETHALLLARLGREQALQRTAAIRTDPRTTIVQASRRQEDDAMRLLARYADKNFSLTDAVSFLVIDELRIEMALSFDRHFRQVGGRFQVIPP